MNQQDDDARLGAYAPSADDLDTFDAREEDDERGALLLTAAVVALVMFGAVVWVAYSNGVSDGGGERVPRVAANEEPYRIRPEDPGGEQTPDTQYGVYDLLPGGEEASQDVSVRPAPEQPINGGRPAVSIETVDADQTGSGAPRTLPASVPDTQAETAPDITPRPAPERPQDRTPAVDTQPAQTEPAQTQPTVAAPTPTQASDVPAAPAGIDSAGQWVVQIASFRTTGDAEAAWVVFQTRFSDISSGLAPSVASVEIADRGTYHRLRIAAFSSRDDASAFCSTLQSRGQDCLVAQR